MRKFNVYRVENGEWVKVGTGVRTEKTIKLSFFQDVHPNEQIIIMRKHLEGIKEKKSQIDLAKLHAMTQLLQTLSSPPAPETE